MSSPSAPNDTWPFLLLEHQRRLDKCKQTPVPSEQQLRQQLTQLFKKHNKERDALRLLNRIRKQHSPILDLASAVDAGLKLGDAGSLTASILGVIKTAVQAALEAKKNLPGFIDETKKLNELVPSLNREHLKAYHDDSRVQKPLLELLRAYMESYFSLFSESAPPLLLCLEPFQKSIEGKREYFQAREQDWERAFQVAREEEQSRINEGGGSAHGALLDRMVPPRTNAQFEVIGELGHGNFGRVSRVRQHGTGRVYAQKFIPAPKSSGARKSVKERVLNEVHAMEKLQHHHIASVSLYTEVEAGFNLIMLPVGDCNLREFLEGRCINAGFPRNQIKLLDSWFGCLVNALAFAHSRHVKHKDLKPSNILIKEDCVYLADFGCAKDYEGYMSSATPEERIAGTPVYWPPESESERGRAADVFALGCVFSEMLTVRQGSSLTDYEATRKTNERDNPYAFSKNLPAVQDWLQNLPGVAEQGPRADVTKLLLEVILIMVKENADERKEARLLKKMLRAEDEFLFCGSCL